MVGSFRTFVPAEDDPRVAVLREEDAYTHAERCLQVPWLNEVFSRWGQLYEAPFAGAQRLASWDAGTEGHVQVWS
jgi:hypothetical protein